LRILAYLTTIIVAFRFYGSLAQFLTLNTFLNSQTATTVSLVALLLLTFIATKLLTMLILKMLKLGEGGIINKVAGLLLGACRWIVVLSIAFMLIDRSPLSTLKTDIHSRSLLGPKIASVGPAMFDFLSMLSPQLSIPAEQLKGLVGKRVEVRVTTDPALLGGFVARIGSEVYDASVSGKIHKFRESLT
jgi:uncharacterized membrane protein required for colicin V production